MASSTPPTGMPDVKPNSTMAIVSLISGVLGFTLFPFVGSVVAVITGFMARREIKESSGALAGDGLATAGLVLGWIGVGLTVLGLCAAGAIIVVPACAAIFYGILGEASLLLSALAVL